VDGFCRDLLLNLVRKSHPCTEWYIIKKVLGFYEDTVPIGMKNIQHTALQDSHSEAPAAPRKTGRPRTFDADQALDQAMKVFWEKGYEGASLPELTEAMGMNRPSLYSVFGNKENLFHLALERYALPREQLFAAALAQPTARAVVEYFLYHNADGQTESNQPHGCLVINGALACSDDAKPIRDELVAHRANNEGRLRAINPENGFFGVAPGTGYSNTPNAMAALGLARPRRLPMVRGTG